MQLTNTADVQELMHDKGELLLRVQTLRQVRTVLSNRSHFQGTEMMLYSYCCIAPCIGLRYSNCLWDNQGLSDWRTKLDTQVRNYQEEMGSLNTSLKSEVGQLRTEFNDLRSTLRQQMDLTVSLAKGENTADSPVASPQKNTT